MRKYGLHALFLLLLLGMLAYVCMPSGGSGETALYEPSQGGASSSGNGLEPPSRQRSTAAVSRGAKAGAGARNMRGADAFMVDVDSEGKARALLAAVASSGANVHARLLPGLGRLVFRGEPDELEKLLSSADFEGLEAEFNQRLVMIPESGEEERQWGDSGRPFGRGALEWLGIDPAAEDRGKGVKIALLDTSINRDAPCLAGADVKTVDLFGLEDGAAEHGSLVASLIAGSSGNVTGIADAASIISYPVLDANGYGNVFDLAEAIVAAADAGADIISMSLGFPHESAVLRAAVDYAAAKGCVLVASAGNEGASADGSSTVCYPAAFDSVMAVGAVNADGRVAPFSSSGGEVNAAAPGVGLCAEAGDGSGMLFYGTSASAPCAAASIAYVAAACGISVKEAASRMLENTNDAGVPGADAEYGNGNVNAARAMNADEPGIHDAAACDAVGVYDEATDSTTLYFTAQNRGTERIGTLSLDFSFAVNGAYGNRTGSAQFSDVEPGAPVAATVKLPGRVEMDYATVRVSSGGDELPGNDFASVAHPDTKSDFLTSGK